MIQTPIYLVEQCPLLLCLLLSSMPWCGVCNDIALQPLYSAFSLGQVGLEVLKVGLKRLSKLEIKKMTGCYFIPWVLMMMIPWLIQRHFHLSILCSRNVYTRRPCHPRAYPVALCKHKSFQSWYPWVECSADSTPSHIQPSTCSHKQTQ